MHLVSSFDFAVRLGIAAVALALGLAPRAEAADHVVVVGFERFHSDEKSDLTAGGKLLMGELNCLSCHSYDNPQAAAVFPKQAPILDGVGNRLRPAWLRKFLADPHQTKAGTTMPNVLADVPPKEREQQVESLVHFLASLGGPAETAPNRQAVARGETLFHSVGCTACHDSRKADAKPLATSVPLGTPSKKYAIPGLAAFLADPLKLRPSGRMPNLNLTTEESRDIASYLLKDLEIESVSNIKYSYYEGNWGTVPDFGKLKPLATGTTAGFDLTVAPKQDAFGMRFEAFLRIPAEGAYTFHIGSDDGSRLLIDGKQVAHSDGLHPFTFGGGGTVKLTAGWHELTADYFEAGGQEELRIEFEGPGLSRQPVEAFLSLTKGEPKKPTKEAQFVADPELAEQGRELFAKAGCASCHQLQHGGQRIASKVEANPITKIKRTGGCLAEEPSAGLPKFAFTARQRLALGAAIDSLHKPAPALPPQQLISHTMTAFNCYACHEREKLGGVEDERNVHFQSNMKEMGDEGRLPPHLTGAGAKLKAEFLKEIFSASPKERPYMFTRMPKFGEPNVGHLVAAFDKADEGKPDRILDYGAQERAVKNAGYQLVGDKMLSCIKCHTFANEKATGIQAISLTSMHKRLRDDWFHKYMLDPAVYRPGTRMPSGWPNGQTFYPKLLDGKVDTQVDAVWAFLSDGPKARLPQGLGRAPIELVAETEAIIYRNFIEGAGPRAIGVGYPEKVNLAFDANNLRIAMLWKGAFMDASKHWVDRGAGNQPPLGDDILKFADGTPLAILADSGTPWPNTPAKEQGYQFRGYRLGENRRPTFLYSFGEVQVEDTLAPVVEKDIAHFRRTLTFKSGASAENLWYRAAVSPKMEEVDGQFLLGDGSRLKLTADGAKPMLRKAGSNMELLVPVKLIGGKATVALEYFW